MLQPDRKMKPKCDESIGVFVLRLQELMKRHMYALPLLLKALNPTGLSKAASQGSTGELSAVIK